MNQSFKKYFFICLIFLLPGSDEKQGFGQYNLRFHSK